MVAVNTRALALPLTGVQRYTHDILARLESKILPIAPRAPLQGFCGHLWEQFVLPAKFSNGLLWSPANTGPLAVRNQVVTIHDAATLDHPEWFSPRFANLYNFLLPRLARRVERIITVSDFSASRLTERLSIPADKISVVYNGVDPRYCPADADSVYALRRKLDLKHPYLLVVGSLEPRKNLERLFKAWRIITNRSDKVELVVAGKMDTRLYKSSGFSELPPNTRLIGYVDDQDLPTLYSGAIAFAYPSIYEGFGLPVVEAMACGTPVITSYNTSLGEIASGAAQLVDPYEPESIAEGIDAVVSDVALRERIIQNGLERASSFSWDTAAEETWTILEESC